MGYHAEYCSSCGKRSLRETMQCPECTASKGVPLDQFWEKDDGVRMDDLIRMERFIISQGTKSAHIWKAWYNIKQLIKASLKYNDESTKI